MTYRNSSAIAGAVVALILAAGAPQFARAETAQSLAFATIGQKIAVQNTSTMRFGTVAQLDSNASVELTPASETVNCGLTLVGGSQAVSASLTIYGAPNQTLGISLPLKARLGRAGRQVEIATFKHNGGITPVLRPDGGRELRIGATLFVAEKTPRGTFTGSFDVIVSNN